MVKFILIGCGRIGRRHAHFMDKMGEIQAVCDTNVQAMRSLADTYNVPGYASIDELLKAKIDADVVAICTPNGWHAAHSIACLKSGYHVLVEKPMALSVGDANGMIQVADAMERHLFVVKQNRYNPPVEALKQLLDNQSLGKVYSIQLNCYWNRGADYYKNPWKGTKDLDGGILYTQFSHFIDLVCWMFGEVEVCHAMGGNQSGRRDIEFEDTVMAQCRFASGAMGSMHFSINSFRQNMEGSLTVFAEKGTVKIGGQYLNELEYIQLDQSIPLPKIPEGRPPNEYGKYTGSMSNHDKVYQNVVDVFSRDADIATDGQSGITSLKFIDKVLKALGS